MVAVDPPRAVEAQPVNRGAARRFDRAEADPPGRQRLLERAPDRAGLEPGEEEADEANRIVGLAGSDVEPRVDVAALRRHHRRADLAAERRVRVVAPGIAIDPARPRGDPGRPEVDRGPAG